jgi:hypothetical protein
VCLVAGSEFRTHVTTTLEDDAVQRLLDDADAAVIAYAGELGTTTEIMSGGGSRIVTSRPIFSVTSVTEREDSTSALTLTSGDWDTLSPFVLVRRRDGTNPSWHFRGPVRVVYDPVDDTAQRIAAIIALVKFDITHSPGLVRQEIEGWSETYRIIGDLGNAYTSAREDILASLRSSYGGMWVA